MFNIAIVGAGSIAERHVEAIKAMNNVKLQAIADIVLEKAEKYAIENDARAYYDYKDMILKEELNAVIINLPHKLHKEAVLFCAEHGVHILLEKPMAVSSSDCEEMIEAAKEHDVKLMIGHVQRYFPANIKAKELLKSGELGKLVMINCTRNVNYFTSKRPKWFLDKEMSGGGIFMNLGAHCFDKILWITDGKIKRVTGKAGYHQEDYNVEGNGQAFMELESGVPVTISCTGYRVPSMDETYFFFTEGAIKLTPHEIWVSRGTSGYEAISLPGPEDAFIMQLQDFIKSVKEDTPSTIPGEYGLEIIKAIEAVYKID